MAVYKICGLPGRQESEKRFQIIVVIEDARRRERREKTVLKYRESGIRQP